MEVWQNIAGFEGLYQISNFGRVKSLSRKGRPKEIFLKQTKDKHGYLMVCLCKNSIPYTKRIHSLVANHLVPNPNDSPVVNHLNGIKTDNKVENLEWVTAAQNQQHSFRMGLQKMGKGSENPNAILTLEQVKEIRRLYVPTKYSQRRLAKEFNVSRSCIDDIVTNRNWSF